MASTMHLIFYLLVHFEIQNTIARVYDERAVRYNAPSGSMTGTSYYGIGADPNYGSFIKYPNRPNGGGSLSISYDPNSPAFNYLVRPNHYHQTYASDSNNNNNNNFWQRPNQNWMNNRYAPGTEGWYATGGNYWYNHSSYLSLHRSLLIFNISFLLIYFFL